MKTILEFEGLSPVDWGKDELLELIQSEVHALRASGDSLGAGEWTVSLFPFVAPDALLEHGCRAITLWVSPVGASALASTPAEIVDRFSEFSTTDLATSTVAVLRHMQASHKSLLIDFKDLLFRLQEPICDVFSVSRHSRVIDMAQQAIANLDGVLRDALAARDTFAATTAIGAKQGDVPPVVEIDWRRLS
jgi:hypothetical protein